MGADPFFRFHLVLVAAANYDQPQEFFDDPGVTFRFDDPMGVALI